MCWGQFVPALLGYKPNWGKPRGLVIHLGENDLVQSTGLDLLKSMKRDLEWLWASWGNLMVFWTRLLPRRVWRGAISKARN